MEWYTIDNIDTIDSPALVVYRERAEQNIKKAVAMVKDVTKLRPHIKTNKIAEVCRMMMDNGITKFKCATIAEAEMVGMIGAPDVLLAYQPVGPKVLRLLQLVQQYPATRYACLIDNTGVAQNISQAFSSNGLRIDVYVDVNNGMNRSGIKPADVPHLFDEAYTLPGIDIVGLHGYDGHIRDTNTNDRQQKSNLGFDALKQLQKHAEEKYGRHLKIVTSGTPTFPTHAAREGIECSPGTFVFWDWTYNTVVPDEPFEFAALVITRVISIIDETTICTDLGHKSIAAENPLPRVHFLNAPGANPIGQSEEHLVVKVPDSSSFKVGDVLYGVPVHVCPTVALYERANVVDGHEVVGEWKVIARDKKITI